MKYFSSLNPVVLKGPRTSEWIISIISLALVRLFLNGKFCIFLSMHTLHFKNSFSNSFGIPVTSCSLPKIFKYLKFTCPKKNKRKQKKTIEFISCILNLHWLRFCSELQPWLSNWSSYNLAFGGICFFFVCYPSISPLPCRRTWPLPRF